MSVFPPWRSRGARGRHVKPVPRPRGADVQRNLGGRCWSSSLLAVVVAEAETRFSAPGVVVFPYVEAFELTSERIARNE